MFVFCIYYVKEQVLVTTFSSLQSRDTSLFAFLGAPPATTSDQVLGQKGAPPSDQVLGQKGAPPSDQVLGRKGASLVSKFFKLGAELFFCSVPKNSFKNLQKLEMLQKCYNNIKFLLQEA